MKIRLKLAVAIICAALFHAVAVAQERSSTTDALKPATAKTDLYPANADAKKDVEAAIKTA